MESSYIYRHLKWKTSFLTTKVYWKLYILILWIFEHFLTVIGCLKMLFPILNNEPNILPKPSGHMNYKTVLFLFFEFSNGIVNFRSEFSNADHCGFELDFCGHLIFWGSFWKESYCVICTVSRGIKNDQSFLAESVKVIDDWRFKDPCHWF